MSSIHRTPGQDTGHQDRTPGQVTQDTGHQDRTPGQVTQDTGHQDTGHRTPGQDTRTGYTRHRTQDTGHRTQDRTPGQVTQDTGHQDRTPGQVTQDTGHQDRTPGQVTQDTGHRTQDTGHRTQDTGHRTQDTGHRTQDTGHQDTRTGYTRHRTQDTGHQDRTPGQVTQDTGHQDRTPGQVTQDTGHRTQDTGHQDRTPGQVTQDTGHQDRTPGQVTQDTGHQDRTPGQVTQDTGHRTQDTGHRTQDTRTGYTRHRTQDTGHQDRTPGQDTRTGYTRHRTQDTGHRTPGQDTRTGYTRHRTQDTGHSGIVTEIVIHFTRTIRTDHKAFIDSGESSSSSSGDDEPLFNYDPTQDTNTYQLNASKIFCMQDILSFQNYESQSLWIANLHLLLQSDISEMWETQKNTNIGLLIATLNPNMEWREQTILSLVQSIPQHQILSVSFASAVHSYKLKFQRNDLRPTADRSKIDINIDSPRNKLKKFIELVTGKIPHIVKWGNTPFHGQLISDYSCDIDSDITVTKKLEDLLPQGIYKLLPKSDFKYILDKKLGFMIDHPTGDIDAHGQPILEPVDLADIPNFQIGEGERFRLYITYNKCPENFTLSQFQTLLWDHGIRPVLADILPLATLQRVSNDSHGLQINAMVGRPGLRFPSVTVEGKYLAGFTEKFKRLLNTQNAPRIAELKTALGDFRFIGVHQGVKDLYTSEIYMGPPSAWRDGNPMYKRKNTAVGIVSTPRTRFTVVDGAINMMFESQNPSEGITTLAPVSNWEALLTSLGFYVEREIMLDCVHIGGLKAVPTQNCTYEGVFKVIIYSGFKYQTIDHVDAKHGFSSISVEEIMNNSDSLRKKVVAFQNHLRKAGDMCFGMRCEVRGEEGAVAAFLQDFKNKVQQFDRLARSTLLIVERTKDLIQYIDIRSQALLSLADVAYALQSRHSRLKPYWMELANYIQKEFLCLVSKPRGYYTPNFDLFTLHYFTQQVHAFGSVPYQAFPLLQILAYPQSLNDEFRDPLPKSLVPKFVDKAALVLYSKKKKSKGNNNPESVLHQSFAPDRVAHIMDIVRTIQSQPRVTDILVTPNARTVDELVTQMIDMLFDGLIEDLPENMIRFPENMQQVKSRKMLTVDALRLIVDNKNAYPYHLVKGIFGNRVKCYDDKLARFINFDEQEVASFFQSPPNRSTRLGRYSKYFGLLLEQLRSFQSIIIYGSRNEANSAKETLKNKLFAEARKRFEVLPCGDLDPNNAVWACSNINLPGGKRMQFLRMYHIDGRGMPYNAKTNGLIYIPSANQDGIV
ncbi:hypothetical protein BCR33DRAFT_752363 [Rhizoclosmatium globosum]|uniref:Uncharacterized protein n=1 Tax=Rhizoclosmatium globosum TaxID=329046 RepID=A0A1Y1ZK76_9FUNG|nr:hypothetical protein BCR33DRAFT_752363 [Rhizoclosmatium globosum]|eukprot:ORY10225.1 hypothetical protein BCR33DRAFT_752363 [Rhizoclosmatium globosum]